MSLSLEEYKNLLEAKKTNKYKNVKTNGYDSKKEAGRAGALKLMQKQGLISDLQEQQRFTLIPSQRGLKEVYNKKKQKLEMKNRVIEQPVYYVADFTYIQDGAFVVEDVKGKRTALYILKRKLMLYKHGIRIKET